MAADPLAQWLGERTSRKLVIDSGLLVVYLIGLFDSRQLRNCRATKSFSEAEFQLLIQIVARFSEILVTPQIVTEVSNHATKLPDSVRPKFMAFFRDVIRSRVTERDVPSKVAASDEAFPRIGITDAAIATVATDAVVLSIDVGLIDTVLRRGGAAVNFNHPREALILRT